MPNTIGAEDKARISAEYKRMIELRIMPAYRALRGFIATEYLPATRTSSGLGALPDGQAWYASLIVQTTASDQNAAQLHALGEQRVQELQAQIATVMKDAKLRGTPKLLRSMRNDRQFQYGDANALINRYRRCSSRSTHACRRCSIRCQSPHWTSVRWNRSVRSPPRQRPISRPRPDNRPCCT